MLTSKTTLRLLVAIIGGCSVNLAAPVASWAGCGGSSPNWTSTADIESVQACVNAAKVGDTITVTGNATWSSTLTVTRGVNLVGSGNPTITGRRILVYWRPDSAARSAHDTLTIRGFTFDGTDVSFEEVGYSGLLRVSNAPGGWVRLVVRSNTFKNMQDSGRAIYMVGQIYGVASSNVFDRIPIALGVYGNDEHSWSTETQAFGVAENFYFEDNTLQFASAMTGGHFGYITSGSGGRLVVRYNTWNFANIAAAAQTWDVHGLQSMQSDGGDYNCGYGPPHPPCNPLLKVCQQHSTMVAEYYGNKVYNWSSAQEWIRLRGGWLLMFNNYYSAARGATYIDYHATACDSCQSSGNSIQRISNTYTWNNFDRSNRVPLTKGWDSCGDHSIGSPYTILFNRDVFTDGNATTFDGAAGVGCGPLEGRPGTCSPGVAYWATSQSCSDISGMVGARPDEAIAGTLYKCTAPNTWTPYYTPYQYPHPFSGPAPPRNVAIK